MGLEGALSEDPRPGARRRLTGREETLLVAVACSDPPAGRARWTLELLADEMVQRTGHEGLSRETVRRRLSEQSVKPWQRKMWCIPRVDTEYVARMEDVLDLYAETPDPLRPVVCFDETPVQLIGETRLPWPAEPGKPARFDYEYRRNGTANLFVFLNAHQPWRHVKVTERKTAHDFAHCMRELVEIHYPDAETVRVVLDNLSAHKPAALYEVFAPELARNVLRRLEFHFVAQARELAQYGGDRNRCVGQCSVWTGAFQTARRCSGRLRIGNGDAMPKGLGSSGYSMSNVLGRNCDVFIHRPRSPTSPRPPEPVKTTVQRY